MSEAVSPLTAGDSLMGRYLLVKELVSTHPWAFRWLATDRILRRTVEVHLLIGPNVADAIDAARRAALVRDARLIHIIDAGRYDKVSFVLTNELAGTPLPEFGSLEPEQARTLCGEVATVLDAAYEIGVFHLTLRPELIHLGAEPHIIVGGLGWDAALWGASIEDPVAALRCEARDTVALLYAALTGHWPGPTPSFVPPPEEVDGSPIPPSRLANHIPGDLDTLCNVSLAAGASGPSSLAEVIDDLGSWHGRQERPRLRLDPRTTTTASLTPIRDPIVQEPRPSPTMTPLAGVTPPPAPSAQASEDRSTPMVPLTPPPPPPPPIRADDDQRSAAVGGFPLADDSPAEAPRGFSPVVPTPDDGSFPPAPGPPAFPADAGTEPDPDLAAAPDPSAASSPLDATGSGSTAQPFSPANEGNGALHRDSPAPPTPAAPGSKDGAPRRVPRPYGAPLGLPPLPPALLARTADSPEAPTAGDPFAELSAEVEALSDRVLELSLPAFEPPPPISLDLPPLPSLDELLARAVRTDGYPPSSDVPEAPDSEPDDDVPDWLRPYLAAEPNEAPEADGDAAAVEPNLAALQANTEGDDGE
ncbi:MAG: hypothetical protein LBJ08_03585 [Bifidobacteriaceae bacterium]|nr:hypothetical protein [Bifidobacteriaceae bacterium]